MQRTAAWVAGIVLILAANVAWSQATPPGMVDEMTFGDAASEQLHQLSADQSSTAAAALGEPARCLLPLDSKDWQGGSVSFIMKVDPVKPNYFTIRLWGSDVNTNRLILFCEGTQIGYRHLGDVDLLDEGSEAPFCNGRFFYNTTILATEMTQGKTSVHLEIRSSGNIWGYGTTWEQYQKPMTEPARNMYRVYTHTDGAFVPPASEKQGSAPGDPPIRRAPGAQVLDQIKDRVNGEVSRLLRSSKPLNQMQMQLMARAWYVKWTPAVLNPRAADQVLKGLDNVYLSFVRDPKFAQADPSTPNPNWFGLGPSGQAISLLYPVLKLKLEEAIDDGNGGKTSRREAYVKMLIAARDWHRRNRRLYTNQTMINDLYGIYWPNRALEVLDATKAMPERACREYLYQAVALDPWLGSDTDSGPARPEGNSYFQLTARGLTRELGYVGSYGEVLDWTTQIYNATRPSPGKPGDPLIRQQLVKIARARAAFRYPALDDEGNRAVRMETVVGWRDVHFPGDVTYCQRPSWDGSPVDAAAATLDANLVGYVQQMLADNQFFASMAEHMKETGFRVTAGLLDVPDNYQIVAAQPASSVRLPMSGGDYVFADEEDGIVAVRNGSDILYASLYWRARYAINNLARVHFITPAYNYIATVRQEEEFDPSGQTYTRPNWVNEGFANGGFHYPGNLQSALTGEILPIAKIPEGIGFKPGQESLFAGRALFYKLRYGNYLIGMNASATKSYDLQVPAGVKIARELVSGAPLSPDASLKIGPMSTAIIYVQ